MAYDRREALFEVPQEKYGVRVLVRERSEKPGGNLELVAYVPQRQGKPKRVKRSAKTPDRKTALQRAEKLAQALAVKTGGLPKAKLRSKFFGGQDVTDLDCLDYYEAEVLPKIKNDGYSAFARARIKALRSLLPRLAEEGVATPLRLVDQNYVDDYVDLRLEAGGLKKDGSGEFRSYDDEDMEEDERRVDVSTPRKDLEFLKRTISAAEGHQVKDHDGKWVRAVQYNPFDDASKNLSLPHSDSVKRQHIMDYEMHDAMLAAAAKFDADKNGEYERLKYPSRFEHYAARCPMYSEMILRVARQGRRRAAIADLQWRDVVLPENGDRMATLIRKILGVRISADEAMAIFPHGMVVWRRKSDKPGNWRFAPMPAHLSRKLRTFRETHHHKDNPKGPLFYRIQDSRRAVSPGMLAQWFPELQEAADLDHIDGEGWHMWRRMFRQERHGHVSNKIVAYVGGWSRLNAIHKLLDVDENAAMNRHYLQVLLQQMYACAAFDASKIDTTAQMAGVSEAVLEQLRDEGYLGQNGLGTP